MSYNQIPIDANGFVTTTITSNGDIVDIFNSNTIPLVANASFTGSWVNTLNYSQIVVSTIADQVGNINVQYSTDSVHVDHYHNYATLANIGENVQTHTHSKFYRVIYTNGAINQSEFRLQSILRTVAGTGSILEADDTPTNFDDCVLTKSILVGQSIAGGNAYVNVKTTSDGGLVINQNIQIDSLNSSTANVTANTFFTGSSVSNANAAVIQLFLKTDQNCLVYLDQSLDGVNWDISDVYEYYASNNDFGINVAAFGNCHRVRVQNIGLLTTTYFRLQTTQVPIYNVLPRSLSDHGWLQTSVNHQEDDSGFVVQYTPFGEQVSVPVTKLIGGTFSNSILDTGAWVANIGTGGGVQPIQGLLTLSTGTTANNAVSIQTAFNARFVAGSPNKNRMWIHTPDAGTVNNTRRWGQYNSTDGAFFELDVTTLKVVTRKNSVDTPIFSGNFNGADGSSFTVDTSSHVYEIILTPQIVYWYINNELLHSSSFTANTWTQSMHLPITMENFNTGGSTANVSLHSSVASTLRLGQLVSQPISKFQSGTTAGITYKSGAGALHAITISGITNNANVTLWDNESTASGTIIWSSGAMPIIGGTVQQPLYIDLKGITFSYGLTINIQTAAALVTTIFE